MALNRRAIESLNRLLTSDLSGATMDELAEWLESITLIETHAKGRAVAAMRAQGASWWDIAKITGKPRSTLRFWHDRYVESQTDE